MAKGEIRMVISFGGIASDAWGFDFNGTEKEAKEFIDQAAASNLNVYGVKNPRKDRGTSINTGNVVSWPELGKMQSPFA
jgi:hypothetical protein